MPNISTLYEPKWPAAHRMVCGKYNRPPPGEAKKDGKEEWRMKKEENKGKDCREEMKSRLYRVQAGVYREKEEAEKAAAELKNLGYKAFVF